MLNRESSPTEERVGWLSHEELLHGQQPVEDAHDAHVVEQHGEFGAVGGRAKVHLHLQALVAGAGACLRLQDAGEHIRSRIHWLLWNSRHAMFFLFFQVVYNFTSLKTDAFSASWVILVFP